jgi:hypothetical protein
MRPVYFTIYTKRFVVICTEELQGIFRMLLAPAELFRPLKIIEKKEGKYLTYWDS